MRSLILYLNEASLVRTIQKKFGIQDGEDLKDDNDRKLFANGVNNKTDKGYVIGNKFWYYLFALGTNLGDEIFYASFIPFWFWNIDGAVGRRVVFIWTLVMYIGQLAKDVLKWPRPAYPAKRLQKKWADEYSMPSTHAMVSISIPFSIIHLTKNRYIYPVHWGIAAAVVWCATISVSRIYFGMHTVLDILVGLLLAVPLTVALIPIIDSLDQFWVSENYGPLLVLVIAVLLIAYYPQSEPWTPTRGDTAMIVSVCAGIHIGSWNNYRLGNMIPSEDRPPYPIIWPDWHMAGLGLVRTALGFLLVLATRNFSNYFFRSLFRWCTSIWPSKTSSLQNFFYLTVKFMTYFLIGFNTVYAIPVVFRYFNIERPTFYTEI